MPGFNLSYYQQAHKKVYYKRVKINTNYIIVGLAY